MRTIHSGIADITGLPDRITGEGGVECWIRTTPAPGDPLRVADSTCITCVTCVPTRAGFLGPTVVVDALGRRVAGGSTAVRPRTEPRLEALHMARRRRCPDSVVHHSDQGRTMRRTSSRNVAARRGSSRRRVQWASAAATRWPRASSPPSNATSSTTAGSLSGPRFAWRAPSTSKGGTARTIAIPASVTDHRPASRRAADNPLGLQADEPSTRTGARTSILFHLSIMG